MLKFPKGSKSDFGRAVMSSRTKKRKTSGAGWTMSWTSSTGNISDDITVLRGR